MLARRLGSLRRVHKETSNRAYSDFMIKLKVGQGKY